MRLVVWILWWVRSSLLGGFRHLYDAPIFFPASAQLTGSEHFLSSQLLFAPLFALTRNAILSANWIALASYPLAAFAMERLLSKLALWPAGSWLAGLVFALGPLRVPASLQILQYLNFYLPVSVLALIAASERPTILRWTTCTVVLTLGLFSSYYMAVQIVIVSLAWIVVESLRGRLQIRRSIALVGAVVVATALLAAFSSPYFLRRRSGVAELGVASSPQSQTVTPAPSPTWDQWSTVAAALVRSWFGAISLAATLLVIALAATVLGIRRRPLRSISVVGCVLSILGLSLAVAHCRAIDGLVAGFIGFFRYRIRFLVLAGFGLSILCAVFLHVVHEWLGNRAYWVTAGLGSLLVAVAMPVIVPGLDTPRAVSRDRGVYEMIRDVGLLDGGGALLELPWRDRNDLETSPDAMLGATIHGLPLINGYTGYFPPYWILLRDALWRLPSAQAIEDLAEMTHLRWLVLRPAGEWQDARRREQIEVALASLSPAPERWELGGWSLYRLTRATWLHPDWYQALQRPVQKDRTLLGAPLVAVPRNEAGGGLTIRPSSSVKVGTLQVLAVDVSNRGAHVWPVSTIDGSVSSDVVYLAIEWLPVDAKDGAVSQATCTLPRDVHPGETIGRGCWVAAPAVAGTYRLEVRLVQVGTDAFDGSEPASAVMTVTP